MHASPEAPSVLVVDDEDWVREPARFLLEELGYAVEEAPDGETALRCFAEREGRFAFVLLDVRLPRMRTDEVIAGLLRTNPKVPILIFTGYERWQLDPKLFELGHVGFLPKPFTIEDLERELATMGVVAAG